MFIITNTCYDGEYTPSKANTLEEAIDNLVAWKADEIEEYWGKEIEEVTDDEVIEWAKDELERLLGEDEPDEDAIQEVRAAIAEYEDALYGER